jgi:hypothetical protein
MNFSEGPPAFWSTGVGTSRIGGGPISRWRVAWWDRQPHQHAADAADKPLDHTRSLQELLYSGRR